MVQATSVTLLAWLLAGLLLAAQGHQFDLDQDLDYDQVQNQDQYQDQDQDRDQDQDQAQDQAQKEEQDWLAQPRSLQDTLHETVGRFEQRAADNFGILAPVKTLEEPRKQDELLSAERASGNRCERNARNTNDLFLFMKKIFDLSLQPGAMTNGKLMMLLRGFQTQLNEFRRPEPELAQ